MADDYLLITSLTYLAYRRLFLELDGLTEEAHGYLFVRYDIVTSSADAFFPLHARRQYVIPALFKLLVEGVLGLFQEPAVLVEIVPLLWTNQLVDLETVEKVLIVSLLDADVIIRIEHLRL